MDCTFCYCCSLFCLWLVLGHRLRVKFIKNKPKPTRTDAFETTETSRYPQSLAAKYILPSLPVIRRLWPRKYLIFLIQTVLPFLVIITDTQANAPSQDPEIPKHFSMFGNMLNGVDKRLQDLPLPTHFYERRNSPSLLLYFQFASFILIPSIKCHDD
jgi:hypothetical protein